MKKESNITAEDGLIEKSSGRNIESPLDNPSESVGVLKEVRFESLNILSEFHVQEIPGSTINFYRELVIYCLFKNHKITFDHFGVREEITPFGITSVASRRENGAIKTVGIIQKNAQTF